MKQEAFIDSAFVAEMERRHKLEIQAAVITVIQKTQEKILDSSSRDEVLSWLDYLAVSTAAGLCSFKFAHCETPEEFSDFINHNKGSNHDD